MCEGGGRANSASLLSWGPSALYGGNAGQSPNPLQTSITICVLDASYTAYLNSTGIILDQTPPPYPDFPRLDIRSTLLDPADTWSRQ